MRGVDFLDAAVVVVIVIGLGSLALAVAMFDAADDTVAPSEHRATRCGRGPR